MRIRGLLKQLDRQGRIIIPKEMLEALEIPVGSSVEILSGLDPDGMPAIVIRRYYKGCCVCGQPVHIPSAGHLPSWRGDTMGLELYGSKRICNACLSEVNAQVFKQK